MSEEFSVYEVYSYSADRLYELVATKANTPHGAVCHSAQPLYLGGYLSRLQARTIVVENGYIDRDFLEDYAGYYVRCFQDYPRKCTRLHFFSASFTVSDFVALLRGEAGSLNASLLQESYLGFVVVRPLPQAPVGRTCIRTYPSEDRRDYPIKRAYQVHLYGLTLEVASLAFQQQDTVAAACATSALWAAFQSTGLLFQHPIPSPVEITKVATSRAPNNTRAFPNHGLTATQMAEAIRGVGLEPLLISAKDPWLRNLTIYAYLRCHIPVVLLLDFLKPQGGNWFNVGKHAITVTGFSIDQSSSSVSSAPIEIRASKIDKLYVHDDNLGPFARTEPVMSALQAGWFRLPSPNPLPQSNEVIAPENLLIPLYHKIRIPFQTILETVLFFDSLIQPLTGGGAAPLECRPEWDVYLCTVNTFKDEIANSNDLTGEQRQEILVQPLPRFIWRATAYKGTDRAFDLLFDATDLEYGRSFIRVVEYDAAYLAAIRSAAQAEATKPETCMRLDWPIIDWLAKSPDLSS